MNTFVGLVKQFFEDQKYLPQRRREDEEDDEEEEGFHAGRRERSDSLRKK